MWSENKKATANSLVTACAAALLCPASLGVTRKTGSPGFHSCQFPWRIAMPPSADIGDHNSLWQNSGNGTTHQTWPPAHPCCNTEDRAPVFLKPLLFCFHCSQINTGNSTPMVILCILKNVLNPCLWSHMPGVLSGLKICTHKYTQNIHSMSQRSPCWCNQCPCWESTLTDEAEWQAINESWIWGFLVLKGKNMDFQ